MEFIGLISALISTASWAGCTILLKKFGERLEPVGMTTVKTFLSFIFLVLMVLFTGRTFLIGFDKLLPVALSGILGIAIGDSLYFASLNRLSPLVISVLFFIGPNIFSGIFGLVFFNEIPSMISFIGIFLILSGLALLIFPIKNNSEESSEKTTLIGILFAFVSIICMSYSMVLIKPVLQEISVLTTTMYRMMFSSIVLIIYAIITKRFFVWKTPLSDKAYSLKLSLTVILATFGGFLLSLFAIKYCQLIVASTLMSLEPLFIMLFMIAFCKYKPLVKEYFGTALIFLGILNIFSG